MKTITLQRVTLTDSTPTYGVLLDGNEGICITLERPWLDNKINVSCIPAGEYKVIRNTASKGGYRLLNVPGRGDILIHAGNSLKDTEGCILPGMNFAGAWHIGSSRNALRILEAVVGDDFILDVRNPPT